MANLDSFLNCDWGTSRLRVRLVERASGSILHESVADEGVAAIAARSQPGDRPHAFSQALERHLSAIETATGRDLDGLPVVISGMASSSLGWRELSYASLPFRLDGSDAVWHELPSLGRWPRSRVFLLSGVCGPLDVMRGEETELIGLGQLEMLRSRLPLATVIMPGTHSKHVRVVDGRIVEFKTFMTGELFALLSRQSSLKPAAMPGGNEETSKVDAAFLAGLEHATTMPLSAALFAVRARVLLKGDQPGETLAFLSGVLIGAEVATLRSSERGEAPVVLCAGREVASGYATACQRLGIDRELTIVSPEDVERLSALGQSQLLDRLLQPG